jgi:hypothetical protein
LAGGPVCEMCDAAIVIAFRALNILLGVKSLNCDRTLCKSGFKKKLLICKIGIKNFDGVISGRLVS